MGVRCSLPDRLPNPEEAFDKRGQLFERHLAGGVRNGLFWLGVGFEEDAVGAGCEGGAGEGGHELALATADAAGRAGQLHAVGGINDGWVSVVLHNSEAAHIDHEVLVAESGAAVGLPDFFGACFFELVGDELHFIGRKELSLLHIDGAASGGSRNEEVGLAAEKGRDLQRVDD